MYTCRFTLPFLHFLTVKALGVGPRGTRSNPGAGPRGPSSNPGTGPRGSSSNPGAGPRGSSSNPGTGPVGSRSNQGVGPGFRSSAVLRSPSYDSVRLQVKLENFKLN